MGDDSVARRLVPPESFVRSYDPPGEVDAWKAVIGYRRALTMYQERRAPSVSSIAEEVDLPPDVLEPWLESDQDPLPVSGLEQAQALGWIDIDPVSDTFRGLNVLVGSTFGLGVIDAETYRPRFSIRTPRDIERLGWAIDRVGLRYAMVRDSEDDRARELRPTKHAPILGRVLVVLGAPVARNAQSIDGLPKYLSVVSREHRLAFARSFLESSLPVGASVRNLRIVMDRPEPFLDELTQFLGDVAGSPVNREGSEVVISSDVAQSLGAVP